MKTKLPLPNQRTRRSWFLPLLLAFIFVMSIFGVVITGLTPDTALDLSVERGGYSFTPLADGRWSVALSGGTVLISASPDELDFSGFDVSLAPLYGANKVYVTHLPAVASAPWGALTSSLQSFLFATPACTEDGPGCEQLPLKTCADASNGVIVIQLLEGAADYSLDGQCYTLRGDEASLLNMVDVFVLSYHGVSL